MLMPYQPAGPGTAVGRWRLLAALLILGAAGLHVAYLAFHCPLDLAPDEAHYWDWSRHLDWSYYSKGPLVAYLIRGGCELFGNNVLGVRFPAVVCGALLLVSVYVLTVQVFRREALACAVVALALTLPVMTAGSTLMTIDSPYSCCWGWALVFGYQAVVRRSAWAWPLVGLMVGIGILAKYTMVLWLPSVGLFLLTSRSHRALLRQRGFWIACAVAAVCCLPILIWNAQHDWVTFMHVFRLAGMKSAEVSEVTKSGPSLYWQGPFIYIGTQCALLLGFWFLAWVAAMWVHRPWREADEEMRYLWWLSAPMFALFLAFSVKTKGGEPNWPITAYISGMVLTAGWLSRQWYATDSRLRRVTRIGLSSACVVGLLLTVLLHHSEWAHPLLAKVAGPPTSEQPLPLRRLDPTCRLRGWQSLGAAVDQICEELRAEGIEPVVVGTGWALPGEIGFYCAEHPAVYSIGPALGDRRSQYDLWRPNPIDDGAEFAGRTFVIVGGDPAVFDRAFDSLDKSHVVTHHEQGRPVAGWLLLVGRGFRGFPKWQGHTGY